VMHGVLVVTVASAEVSDAGTAPETSHMAAGTKAAAEATHVAPAKPSHMAATETAAHVATAAEAAAMTTATAKTTAAAGVGCSREQASGEQGCRQNRDHLFHLGTPFSQMVRRGVARTSSRDNRTRISDR
jgi:hypothetical protein